MYRYIVIIVPFLFCTLLFGQSEKILNQVITEYQADKEAQSLVDKMRWPDNSSKNILKQIKQLTAWQDKLNEVQAEELSEASLINLEMLSLILDNKKYNMEFGSHLMPLNAEGGFLTQMVYATSYLKLKTTSEKQDYLLKLESCPDYLKQQISMLQEGIQVSKTLPKVVIDNCIAIIDQQLAVDPSAHYLANPLTEDIQEEGVLTIKESIYPALQDFKKYLQDEYTQHTRKEIGVSNIADGKSYYEQRVRYYTTLDMSPEEVFQTGQSEVKRIREEMQTIIDELEFEGSYAEFLDFLRTDEQFYPKTPEQILHHAAWIAKKAEEQLPKYFTKLPRIPFTVNPVPAAIAENYTAGRYSPGSTKNQKAGEYWVNTTKLKSRPLYALPALTLHEAVPGHHLQIMLAEEIEDVPTFRNETYLSAYGEGWGLYAEYWGKEAGLYTTLYEDFGRLTYEMWRACRLVVDPGMHYMGWTRQEALDFMASNTALSLHEVKTEIDRYIGWPGQAVSYKIGELKIRELRKIAEEQLGDQFDIRAFHDLILKNGSIPLTTLERLVNAYIQSVLSK